MSDSPSILPWLRKLIGATASHDGYELMEYLVSMLREISRRVVNWDDNPLSSEDNYPDFVGPFIRRSNDDNHECHLSLESQL
jgi:hypothetical protein